MRKDSASDFDHEWSGLADPSVTKAAIAEVVRAAYAQAAADHLLADHLKEAIGGSRGPHVEHACRFWSAALTSNRRANESFGPPDLGISGLSPCCFQRWLALFRRAVRARWPSELAEPLIRRAEEVANSIRSGLFVGSDGGMHDPVEAQARMSA